MGRVPQGMFNDVHPSSYCVSFTVVLSTYTGAHQLNMGSIQQGAGVRTLMLCVEQTLTNGEQNCIRKQATAHGAI